MRAATVENAATLSFLLVYPSFTPALNLYQMIIYVHEEGSHPSQPSIYARYIWNMTNQLSIVCTLV